MTNWNNRTIAEYDAKGCVTGVTNCAGAYPTNWGGVSYDYTNICAGGSIRPPTLTSNVLYDAALDSGIKGDCITVAAVAAKGMQMIGIGATPDVAYPTVDTNATTNTCHPVPPIALVQVGPPPTPPPLFKAQLKYKDSNGVLNVLEGLFYITNPVVKGFTVVPPLSYDNATYLYLQILTTVATDQEWVWYGNQTNSDGTITVTNGVSTGIQVPIPAIP